MAGKVIEYNNWWGEKNPNLNKLIIYDFDNNLKFNYLYDNNYIISEGCTSSVIQIDDNNSAFTFRRDSSSEVYVNIIYQNNLILQYKTDDMFFWHAIINEDGWMVGNGGVDNPHYCEKLEAFVK